MDGIVYAHVSVACGCWVHSDLLWLAVLLGGAACWKSVHVFGCASVFLDLLLPARPHGAALAELFSRCCSSTIGVQLVCHGCWLLHQAAGKGRDAHLRALLLLF